MHSLTIRMGAAHWDATLHTTEPPTIFNFRQMNTDQRKHWYGAFMDSIRKVYSGRRRRSRSNRGGRRHVR